MDHKVLKNYMMQFSTEELKKFLGTDLVESLLEWNIGNEAFASKGRLSDMILCQLRIFLILEWICRQNTQSVKILMFW